MNNELWVIAGFLMGFLVGVLFMLGVIFRHLLGQVRDQVQEMLRILEDDSEER
ncbi:hypothetical protein LCGC14_2814560 [marine sediment metagenome]|uniref:Uncharacterized protein n=1 Tax=marine sediment metagenome TaxID=412755 RepID=A0A0F8YIW2_9ZZZZ